MTPLEPGRREVNPSKRTRTRRAPSFGRSTGVSVPISIGLPLIAVGLALIVAAANSGGSIYWITGALTLGLGLSLFATGKRL